MIRIGEGTRPTVVLHGFMGQAKNLRSVTLRWAERDASRAFLILDLPGHGEAAPLTDDMDLRAMGRDVMARAREAGLRGPLDLVGHSLGGRVSLAASLALPEEVRSVTLLDISPSPIPTDEADSHSVLQKLRSVPDTAPDRRDLREALVTSGVSPGLSDWLVMNVVQDGDVYRWRIDREAWHRLHVRVNPEDLWDAVERKGARVRCIRGGRSEYVSDADAQRMQTAGCEVVTIPGAGHFLHVDAQDQVVDALTRDF